MLAEMTSAARSHGPRPTRAALRHRHVNVPPVQRMELENWLWKTNKIRIRGGEPSKLRLSTPYYMQKKDMQAFLDAFDEYKKSAQA